MALNARGGGGDLLVPSLLDRLSDDEPDRRAEVPFRQSLAAYRASVIRDLQDLLNTRHPPPPAGAARSEAGQSLIVYGLPDLSAMNPRSRTDVERLQRAILGTLRLFEPRLTRVRVTVEHPESVMGRIAFRVAADLKIDPRPVPVVFDTVLDGGRQVFSVQDRTG
ncbi:MAG: type VI secretion system baseplate subunit TssE [Alphaproteobacteria bacterium]